MVDVTTEGTAVAERPPLGLGTANLGNLRRELSDEQAWGILEAAWDCGVRHFDTAPHYGLGLAERRLGEFLRTRPREEVVVSTKVGRLLRPDPDWSGGLDDAEHFVVPARLHRVWDVSLDGMRRSLEESLTRMGLDRADVVYLHDPESSGSPLVAEALGSALAQLRDDGATDEVGVASMSTSTLAAHARTGLLDVLMVAGRHTLLDQSAAERVFPDCRRHGTRVVAAAVFNSGLLSDEEPSRTSWFDYQPAAAELVERTRRIAGVCRDAGVSLATAAVQYPLQDEVVSHVVAGAADPAQVRANAASSITRLPSALWARLREEGLLP